MSAAAPPPPPPGPPPFQADLSAVYRPDEDPALTGCVGARASPDSEALVFGDFEGPPHRSDAGLARGSKQSSAALLIDLDDSSGGVPSEPGAAADAFQPGGLLADLPSGVSLTAVEGGAAYIDLSAPRLPSTPAAADAAAARASASAGPGGRRPSGLPVIPDAAGFGSDDLFGQRAGQERNLGEELKGEAAAAWSSVVRNLPQEVKTQIPDCMAPPPEDPNLELNFTADGSSVRQGQGLPAQAGGALTADQHHAAMAVSRACEGRWVPTYMRHQMTQNGHHAVPTAAAPNAHEFASGTRLPTVQQTLDEMGTDAKEAAQTMVAFVLAFLSSLATQCQMCSHQTASTMHDQVVTFGEGMCSAATVEEEFTEERVCMGPLVPESAAGYGPMRSRVMRTIQGVTFARLIGILKARVVGASMPPELRRLLRDRTLARHSANHDLGTEDMMFSTDVNQEALPQSALQHVCLGCGPLTCRETWHVENHESRAAVEISNVPTNASVTVFIRVDITGRPDGGGCEVDSRLFAKPREAHSPLPLGLVEQLTEVHHRHSESLRDVLMALAAAAERSYSRGAAPGDGAAAAEAASSGEPAPDAARSAAQPSSGGAPPPTMGPPARQASAGPASQPPGGAPPGFAGPSTLQVAQKVRDNTGVDNALLLKLADGI